MALFDVTLLLILAAAVAIVLKFRTNNLLRALVTLALLGTIILCLFSLWAFSPRLATSAQEKAGKQWSPEFRDGVLAAAEVNRPFFPYILFSSLGLALLAIIRPKSSPAR